MTDRDFSAIPLAPGGEGLLGHNSSFRNDRMGVLRSLTASTHPLMRLNIPFPGIRAVAVNDPDIVQEALVEKAKAFNKSDMLRFSLWNLAGEGLFTSNGDLWRRQRKLLAPLFTPRALEAYADDMVQCAHRTVDAWQDGQSLALVHETTRLTMGVAGKTLFDADTFSEADEIGNALTVALGWTGWIMARPFAIGHVIARRAMLRVAGKLADEAFAPTRRRLEDAAVHLQGPVALFGTRGRALAKAMRFLDDHVQNMIDERRSLTFARAETAESLEDSLPQPPRATKTQDHGDLLTRLLQAKDEDGASMSDRQVRDEVLTLFVAGHETTATGLAWTIYYACRDPAMYAALEREADAVGDAPTVRDLPRLDLCLRAFKEGLRLAPPVYVFGRDSVCPVSLNGFALPAPTNVMFSPWVMHHSQRFWDDPERFNPDRFKAEDEAKRHRYVYLPFGGGPRVCLGNHFAYMEAQFALAVLFRRYRFELLSDDEPDPGATLRPKHGVRMRVIRRKHVHASTHVAAP